MKRQQGRAVVRGKATVPARMARMARMARSGVSRVAEPAGGVGPEADAMAAAPEADVRLVGLLQRNVAERQRVTVLRVLNDRGATLPAVLQAAGDAQQSADLAVEIMTPATPAACRAGCHWCCHVSVSLTVPEALSVASYLREMRSAEELAEVMRRVAELDDTTRGLTSGERAAAKLWCALLGEDGRCTVYSARPLMCRGWLSAFEESCQQAWETSFDESTIYAHTGTKLAVSAVERGLMEGLRDGGLEGTQVELTAALRIALEVPDAAERWLGGEPLFEAARFAG